jgi:opacity protein-like surface antigen
MTKHIYFVVLYILCALSCIAQNIQKFEGEATIGFTVPLGNYHNGEKMVGPDFGLELRHNIPHTPWDCGVLLNATTAVYKYDEVPKTEWYREQSNRSVSVILMGDYNFKQGSKFNPYIGVGLGISSYEAINEVMYKSSGTSFIFRPRVGIELFRHLRVGMFSSISRAGYHNMGISIGVVIGGCPKKD